VLVPTIHICKIRSKNNDTMFDGFNHALRHPVALGPLGCSALMLDRIILAHHIKLCNPNLGTPYLETMSSSKNLAVVLAPWSATAFALHHLE
jgi:hypothetical protein